MTTLCNILHHRSHKVDKEPSCLALVEIGVLCDEYDCGEALETWSKTWLAYFKYGSLSPKLGVHKMSSLLYPFFAFNDLAAFRQISLMVVYRTSGFISKPLVSGPLPDFLLGKVPSGQDCLPS